MVYVHISVCTDHGFLLICGQAQWLLLQLPEVGGALY